MSPRGLTSPVALLSSLAILFVVGGAAAATGTLEVGDVIPGGQDPNPATRLEVDETVLATGVASVAGPWRVTAYESAASAGQPAGLPCIRLVLLDPPPETVTGGSGFCGELEDGFGAVSLPAINRGEAELLILGVTPENAVAVELTGGGAERVRAKSLDGGSRSAHGNVFVLSVPPDRETGELIAIDEHGHALSKRLDATGFFDRLRALRAPGDR